MALGQYVGRLTIIFSMAFVIISCSAGGGGITPPPQSTPPVVAPAPTESSSEPTEAVSEPEAAPTEIPPLEAVQINGYRDNFGSYRVVGLVRNNTDSVFDNIEVAVEIFDAAGLSLHSDVASTSLYTLAPGETTPFSLWVFKDLPSADHSVATVVGNSIGDINRVEVEVRGVTVTVDDDGNVHVTGELYNEDNDPIQIDGLAAATFDARGGLMTAEAYSVASRYLDPGEAGPFRVTMTGPEGGIAEVGNYHVYINAESAEPEDYYGLTLTEPPNSYLDSFDSFHLVGEIANNTEETLNVDLLAAIYDAEDNVLDVSSTSLPIDSLAPGETLPYDFDFWGPLNYKDGTIDSANNYSVQWDPYWTWTSSTACVELPTQNDIQAFDEYNGIFTGEVVNNSGEPLSDATVIISIYNVETSQILAMDYENLFDEIPEGESAEYEIYVDVAPDFDPSTSQVVITARGELP